MNRSHTLTALTAATGLAALAPAGYLALLSAMAARPKSDESSLAAVLKIAVLVPAHDEEILVARCVSSLLAADYPSDQRRVIVIADNCTDATAEAARSAGAEVLERSDPTLRGKGHALNWAIAHLLQVDPSLEAFVVVDADSVVDPALLRGLVSAAAAGAQAVQGDYQALVDGQSDSARLRGLAFTLIHRVRFSGKAELGLPCSLVGNGMLFTRSLVEEHPWTAYSEVEDLEYSILLRMAGIGPVYARSAELAAPVASAGPASQVQRRRWEGGRARVARRYLPLLLDRMVRKGRWDLWDAAADLAVPPIGVLAPAVVAGTGATVLLRSFGAVPSAAVFPWIAAATALPVHVLLGLMASESPAAELSALRAAPAMVARESRTRIGMLLRPDAGERWVRTPRSLDATTPGARQVR